MLTIQCLPILASDWIFAPCMTTVLDGAYGCIFRNDSGRMDRDDGHGNLFAINSGLVKDPYKLCIWSVDFHKIVTFCECLAIARLKKRVLHIFAFKPFYDSFWEIYS